LTIRKFILSIEILLVTHIILSYDAVAENVQGNKQISSQEELNQLLAPLALYPDSLLTQNARC